MKNEGCFRPLFYLFSLFALAFLITLPDMIFGVGVFGPTRTDTVTVNRLYVDNSGNASHYMVSTDRGVFEVDNSVILGIYNSDELYSSLEAGKTYNVVTEGNKVNNFLMEHYPYITKIEPVTE